MKISDHDLRQLDAESLHTLPDRDALERLALRLIEDLKEARERLNQTPDNSSRPPSSRDPWSRKKDDTTQDVPSDSSDAPSDSSKDETDSGNPKNKGKKSKKKNGSSNRRPPGRQKGSQGYARTQQLPITSTVPHYPLHCFRCGATLPSDKAVCYTGYESLNAEFGDTQSSVL